MNIGFPRVVGVGVEGIAERWEVRGISRWVCEGWCIYQRRRPCYQVAICRAEKVACPLFVPGLPSADL